MKQLVHEVPHRFLRHLPPSNLTERHPVYYLTVAALWLVGLSAFAEARSITATALLPRKWRRAGMPASTRRMGLVKWWLPIVGHLLVSILMLWMLPIAA